MSSLLWLFCGFFGVARIFGLQGQLGHGLVVCLIYLDLHKHNSIKRLALTFAFFLGFGSLGIRWAAAQEHGSTNPSERVPLERAKPGYPAPQSMVPAQPPALAQPPGYMSRASASATPNPRSQAGAKTATVN